MISELSLVDWMLIAIGFWFFFISCVCAYFVANGYRVRGPVEARARSSNNKKVFASQLKAKAKSEIPVIYSITEIQEFYVEQLKTTVVGSLKHGANRNGNILNSSTFDGKAVEVNGYYRSLTGFMQCAVAVP